MSGGKNPIAARCADTLRVVGGAGRRRGLRWSPPRRAPSAPLLALLFACWFPPAGGDEVRFERGLLFEIDAGAARPCHLFGTIHSEDPRVLDLPPAVEEAFDRADVLVMEAIPDEQAFRGAMASMLYSDGRTLEGVVGPRLFDESLQALSGLGMSAEAVKHFKPWAVVTLLSVPRPATGEFLDIRLYKAALEDGKEVVGLETLGEQLAVFDGLSLDDQIALLRDTLARLQELPEAFERLLQAYLERDIAELLRLSDRYLRSGDEQLAARLEEAALAVRNLRMVRRMEGPLGEGGCFIAVGALHLPGPGGILQRLHGRGYSLSLVY